MEKENKEIQKQIDWINVNLRREIQERMASGSRLSGTIWYLDQRVQKLELAKLSGNRKRQFHCRMYTGLMMLVSLILIILYVVKN